MKKGALLLTLILVLIASVVLTACMSIPPGNISRTWNKTEIGEYVIKKVQRDESGAVTKSEVVGKLTITLEPHFDTATVSIGEETHTGSYFDKIIFDAKYDNGDYVFSETVYSMGGVPIKEHIKSKATSNGKVTQINLQAQYENKEYSYTAWMQNEEYPSGETRSSTISFGEYSSSNIYFGNQHMYMALRAMYDLNSKDTAFSLTYKLPDWSNNQTVQVTATTALSTAEIELSATDETPIKMLCHELSINTTSTFPGKGKPISVFFIRSDHKENGAYVTGDNVITVSDNKTARFVLGGFDEGEYSYRLTKYSAN